MDIPKHKVFISYYHAEDQNYKNALIGASDLFKDCSVHEDEVDADDNMTDEQIRREIRDKYISDATVLLLLCGRHTKERKYIDWEIQAAMTDYDNNPKMGIVVVNLPSIKGLQKVRSVFGEEDKQYFPSIAWVSASNDYSTLKEEYPYLPERIVKNMTRNDVKISIIDWEQFSQYSMRLKGLIDVAFNHRKEQDYDISEKLRRRNS